MFFNNAVLAVDGDSGEVADVLVRARKLVKQRGLAAVLVADEREGQSCSLGQGIAAALWVIFTALAESRVAGRFITAFIMSRFGFLFGGLDLDLIRVVKPERQLVAVDLQLHWVAAGSELHHCDLRAGDHTHIQKMLPQRALAVELCDANGLSDFYIF